MKNVLVGIMGVVLAFTLNGCVVHHGHQGKSVHHKAHHHVVHHKVKHHDGNVVHKKDVTAKKVEKKVDTKVMDKESK